MSSFIYCSMVGVVSVYPQIRKIIQFAFVSCVLYHHDVKVSLYDSGIDCRRHCTCLLCVPMYQLFVGNFSVFSVCCCGSSCGRRVAFESPFLKQLYLLCLKRVDGSNKGRYYEQQYNLYCECVDSIHGCLHYSLKCMYLTSVPDRNTPE